MTCKLICVAPELVSETWPHVRGLVADAVERCGDYTEQDFCDAVHSGTMLLWLATTDGAIYAIAITELTNSEKTGRVCHLKLGSGDDMRDWFDLREGIEAFARAEGCSRVRIEGRQGWARMFRDYTQPFVTLEKILD